MKQLRGRVAVITGGAGGIGKAMADRFAGEGMKVVLADLKQDRLDEAVADLRAGGAEAIGVRTDVSSLESVEALRDAALAEFGAVHVVCNNAGVASGAHGRLWEHEINDWRFAMSVHVYGVINGINAFVPHLIEAGEECHVVNTSSNNGGFSPIAQSPTYAVWKAAVVTLSECLWGQLKDAGAVGVSDDGVCVMSSSVMRRALEYGKNFDLPVIQHCEDHDLTAGADMHEGAVSARLGLRGWPRVAEDIIVARDVLLAEVTGARYHVAHVSSLGAVRILREAKSRGIRVSADGSQWRDALLV